MADEVQKDVSDLGVQTSDDFHRLLEGVATYQLLRERQRRLSQIAVIALADKSGNLVSSTNSWPVPRTNISDREHFQYIKNNNDRTVYISSPVIDRVTGLPTIFFSRRVNGANHEFLGMVSVGVRLSYFELVYKSIESLRALSLLFLRSDGSVILRYPDRQEHHAKKVPAASYWYRLVSQGSGHYRSSNYFGRGPSLVALHTLANYPLVVNIAVSESAALATWRLQAIILGFGTVLLLLCAAFLLRSLSSQFRRLATAGEMLAKKTEELRRSMLTIDAALNNISQGIVMFDSSARILVSNQRYTEMYGLSSEAVRPGRTLRELLNLRVATGTFCPDEIEQNISNQTTAVSHGSIFKRIAYLRDGRIISIVNHPMEGGGWVASHEDITEAKRAEERLACEAYVDTLTDLPNRKAFYEQLEQALDGVAQGRRLALLYLDLDRLKRVNDTLGHLTGDALLKSVADRLRECVRDIGWVARLSGDEFAIVHSMFDQPKDVELLAERIIEAIREPFDIDGHEISASVSVGIAIAPTDATETNELLKAADIALYEAKNIGRGAYCLFEPQLQERIQKQAQLEQELQQAFVSGEFELFYQPVASLANNKIVSFEALLRWNHPRRGIVSPAEFIPIAEETGLIVPLGEWVLRTACAEAARWPADIQVAVNLSAAQLSNKNLANVIVGAVAAAGIPPCKLELELTESVLIQNTPTNEAKLKSLHELGIQFAVDDFGTGYSSLSYLLSFPFHRIKIDRKFITALADHENSRAIVRAIGDLAQNLNMRVTAEGIETERQLQQVRKLGCTEIQGYLLSRPRPAAEVLQLLPQRGETEVNPTSVDVWTANKNQKMCHVRPDLVCSHRLTEHECDVMAGIVAGESCEETARQLNLSPQLVESRRAAINEKHGVETSADVVRIMLTKGCAPLPAKSASHRSEIKVASRSR